MSGTQDADGNYVDVATVTLSATDAGSGVASVEYKLDDGAWTAYTAAVAVNAPGEHMVSYRATDAAGNVSEEGMAHFTVVSAGHHGADGVGVWSPVSRTSPVRTSARRW